MSARNGTERLRAALELHELAARVVAAGFRLHGQPSAEALLSWESAFRELRAATLADPRAQYELPLQARCLRRLLLVARELRLPRGP